MNPVLGFCGASGSGKTTLLIKLVSLLSARGYKIGVIKHHGHGGAIKPPDEGKDSYRLSKAGAYRVALVHAGGVEVTANASHAGGGPLPVAASFMSGLDFVLVEGYKKADITKIEVVAPGKNPILPPNGRLAALAIRGGGPTHRGIPVLDADDIELIAGFVLSALGLTGAPSRARLWVNGKSIEMNPFVTDFVARTVSGMVKRLKGGESGGRIEVCVEPELD